MKPLYLEATRPRLGPRLISSQNIPAHYQTPAAFSGNKNTFFTAAMDLKTYLRSGYTSHTDICDLASCKTWKYARQEDLISSTASNCAHLVERAFNCISSNVIYCLQCGCCFRQYIAEKGQQVSQRLSCHRADTLNKLLKAVTWPLFWTYETVHCRKGVQNDA